MKHENLVIKLAILFYLCSIIGYIYEILLCYFYTGKIFSHGILNGPWLPIYGTGGLIIMAMNKYKNNFLIIFLGSFFLSGILEGLCGFLLLKFLKMRLWDYTGYFLNIGGFVCFLSCLCFGIGGILITYIIYPLVEKLFNKINKKWLKGGLSVISLFFILDIIATILK